MSDSAEKSAQGGVCCRCGYSGDEEIACPKATDPPDSCCNHWWDGPDDGKPATPTPPPQPAPAVRLARIKDPTRVWTEMDDCDPPAATWDNFAEACEKKIPDECGSFECGDLNDLALVERRVCEAGFGHLYRDAILEELWKDESRPKTERQYTWFQITAPAEQRWRALLALLDANPDLERRLTGNE